VEAEEEEGEAQESRRGRVKRVSGPTRVNSERIT